MGARRGTIVCGEVVGERCGANAAPRSAVERCAQLVNRTAAVAPAATTTLNIAACGSGLQMLNEPRATQRCCHNARNERRRTQRAQRILCCGIDVWAFDVGAQNTKRQCVRERSSHAGCAGRETAPRAGEREAEECGIVCNHRFGVGGERALSQN